MGPEKGIGRLAYAQSPGGDRLAYSGARSIRPGVGIGNIMQIHTVKPSREGRVLIPAEVRAAMGLGKGTHVGLAGAISGLRRLNSPSAIRQ